MAPPTHEQERTQVCRDLALVLGVLTKMIFLGAKLIGPDGRN